MKKKPQKLYIYIMYIVQIELHGSTYRQLFFSNKYYNNTWSCLAESSLFFYVYSYVHACSVDSVISNSLWPYRPALQALLSTGLSRQEYGVDCHAFLQGIFQTQGSNPSLPCLLHYRWILSLSYQENLSLYINIYNLYILISTRHDHNFSSFIYVYMMFLLSHICMLCKSNIQIIEAPDRENRKMMRKKSININN